VKIVIRALTLLKLMTLAKAALKGNDYCQLAQVARFIPEWAGIRNCFKHFLGIKVDNHDYKKKSNTEVLIDNHIQNGSGSSSTIKWNLRSGSGPVLEKIIIKVPVLEIRPSSM